MVRIASAILLVGIHVVAVGVAVPALGTLRGGRIVMYAVGILGLGRRRMVLEVRLHGGARCWAGIKQRRARVECLPMRRRRGYVQGRDEGGGPGTAEGSGWNLERQGRCEGYYVQFDFAVNQVRGKCQARRRPLHLTSLSPPNAQCTAASSARNGRVPCSCDSDSTMHHAGRDQSNVRVSKGRLAWMVGHRPGVQSVERPLIVHSGVKRWASWPCCCYVAPSCTMNLLWPVNILP